MNIIRLAALLVGLCFAQSLYIIAEEPTTLRNRIQPVATDTGFRMQDYFVWCGAVVKVGDTFHMFASRWPVSTKFPEGYREHSEIVRAASPKPEGPYSFQEVIIGHREKGKWDSGMAHNPVIYRVGDGFALFYNASDVGSRYRQIGVATAPSITGPWTRSDEPLNLGVTTDANNPSVWLEPDGIVRMVWRDKDLRVRISTARTVRGPYTVVNDNVWPEARLEDFFYFKSGGKYHLICEDNAGKITGHERWGAHLVSDDGLKGWRKAPDDVVYDHDIAWTDGSKFHPVRRERPWLLVEDGYATFLFSAVYDGQHTWNQCVPIRPGYPVGK